MTTMGMGKVRMKTPERAQKPPMILPVKEIVFKYTANKGVKEMKVLPSKVRGFMSYPTVVIVINPHLRNVFLLIAINIKYIII